MLYLLEEIIFFLLDKFFDIFILNFFCFKVYFILKDIVLLFLIINNFNIIIFFFFILILNYLFNFILFIYISFIIYNYYGY